MFIYEFTAGLQEIIEIPVAEVEEEEYDPHHHRKIPHPTTYMETMIHMLKGSIGAGVLAMPYAVSQVGLVVGMIGLPAVCDYYGFIASIRVHLCMLIVPMLLINLVKNLKMMTPLSMISNVIQMLSMLLLLFYIIEDKFTITKEMFTIQGPKAFAQFMAITLFALEAVGVILALEYNMQEPKRFSGSCGLMSHGMMMIMGLYVVIGVGGFLKYGHEVKPAITLNLPESQMKAQAARVGMAIAIFLSFPIQNYVAYAIIWRKFHKILEGSKQPKSAIVIKLADYSLRLGLVLFPWLVALASPTLGPFIELAGAFCLSLLAVVFPAIMDMCERYPARYGIFKGLLLRDTFVLVMGCIALIAGVFVSLLQIVSPESGH